MTSTLLRVTVILAAAGFAGTSVQGQGQNFDNVEVETRPVQGNVYMLIGAGGNVTVQVGNDGVLVVDTQFAPMAPKLLAAIRKLSDKPIRYIINTHVHGDHSGGNEAMARADGASIIGHANILKAHEAVLATKHDGRIYTKVTKQRPVGLVAKRPRVSAEAEEQAWRKCSVACSSASALTRSACNAGRSTDRPFVSGASNCFVA